MDGASGVMDISSDLVSPSPTLLNGLNQEYIKGIVKLDQRLLMLLQLADIFT
nr:hypothetical protein [Anaerobacillus alkalilacustris]